MAKCSFLIRGLAIDSSFNLDTTQLNLLDQILVLAQTSLQNFADRVDFSSVMSGIYGSVDASSFQKTWSGGSLDLTAQIQIVSATNLNGALAAFSAQTNTIYLSDSLLTSDIDTTSLSRIFLEEYGHWVDTQLNGSADSTGDEGELFAARVTGVTLTEAEGAVIQAENDTAIIILDKQPVLVEQSLATPLASSPQSKQILVQWDPRTTAEDRANARAALGSKLIEEIHTKTMQGAGLGILELLEGPPGQPPDNLIKSYANRPGVKYAEVNYIYQPSIVSNDTSYTDGRLWGMYGDDSPATIGPTRTTNQYGSQAEKAWNDGITGSANVFVGIIDEGVQVTHPDLNDNIWVNPFETPNDGIDNDGNGYIDDIYGWDFVNNNNSVYDAGEDAHGTHVAGTIGGEGGNSTGVVGVNWDVTMISTKFLGPNGGSTANAIKALDYLTDLKKRHGINIVASNNSWGGGGYSQALHDAIIRSANQNILFVAAAGNSASDNDTGAFYPSNYNTTAGTSTQAAASYDAVIAVASITNTGALSSFSSYGATTVDIGAPGSGIWSSVPTDSYASYSGTSMATPHVTGAVALYASAKPESSAATIKSAILASATPTASLNGKTVTGGRLNVYEALDLPVITIAATDAAAGETNNPGEFTLTRTGSTAAALTVNLSRTGTATNGTDYTTIPATTSFAAGSSTAIVNLTVTDDLVVEGNETAILTVTSGTGYTAGATASATVTITDNDVNGSSNNDNLVGDSGQNALNGVDGSDNLNGGAGNDLINGGAGVDTLTGGTETDTFVFQFGQSLSSAPDRVTDFAIGTDKIDLLTAAGAAIAAPVAFSRAADNTSTSLANVISAVFTDANGSSSGNQALEVNSAALVVATASAIAGTYLIVNDGTKGFRSANDLVINLTGYSGSLPGLGVINPLSTWFI